MPRLLIAIFLTATMLIPASAEAQGHRTHRPRASNTTRRAPTRRIAPAKLPSHDPVVLATAVAERYWGAAPCGGQIAVRAEMALPAELDPTTDGWATFNSSLGQNNLEAPAATYTQCAISLARWQWPTRAAMQTDWPMFCLTVIHEMGHLLGHPHSLAPLSVMAPVFNDESHVPAICRANEPSGSATAARTAAH